MTQEDVNILIRKLVFQGGDPFDISNKIYASHLRSQIELLNRVISSENSERILDKKEDEISKLQSELKILNQ